jgi:uncharacterized protein (DUF608 family)
MSILLIRGFRPIPCLTGPQAHASIAAFMPQEERQLARETASRQQDRARRLAAWRTTVFGPSRRRVYTGRSLTDIAMPLGGIGAGSIALSGSGELCEWQIFNRVNSRALVPDSFFAIRTSVGSNSVCRALAGHAVGELAAVKKIRFVGEYPLAMLSYADPELPVRVSLQAFSPFIPLNEKDSALPAALFIFTVSNPGRQAVAVSLAAALQNAIGYDGLSEIQGVANPDYGGNVNSTVHFGAVAAIHMTNSKLEPSAREFGTMSLLAFDRKATLLPAWDDFGEFAQQFAAEGRFRSRRQPASPPGRTWNGALAVPFSLAPGEEKSVVFALTWHFPNHYAEYDKNLASYRLGNMYSNWFGDSLEVGRYLAGNLDRLVEETRRFRDTFYDSNLPYWFLDCISSQISTLRSQTCMWIEDGTFAAFEGCGCCPMNCTHVWNYEQALAQLFPVLERNMRQTDLTVQQDPSGFIHHRTVLPLSLPRATPPFIDGHLGTVLKAYREHLQSADRSWLDTYWPRIKAAMAYALKEWDPNGDGVVEGEQWNTYDCAVYGENTFIGALYLAALRAAEEMATLEGEPDLARQYHELFEKGSAAMDAALWNGEYYVQKYDAQTYTETQYGSGCLSDQLLGQWWAHVVDLGDLFPPDHVKKTLASIFKHNWRDDFTDFVHSQRVFASGRDRGLLICTWPRGGRPDKPILYCDEVWTGNEYQVAAHMIYAGLTELALMIVKAARDRYSGDPRPPFQRNPWNEIECGEHYARAMSSWSLLLAASGYHYDGPHGLLAFSPRLRPEDFRAFFITAEGYGTFSQKQASRSYQAGLRLASGQLSLTELRLGVHAAKKQPKAVSVTVNRKTLPVEWRWETPSGGDGTMAVLFPEGFTLRAGETLVVRAQS